MREEQEKFTEKLDAVLGGLKAPRQETGGILTPLGNEAFPGGLAKTPESQTRTRTGQMKEPTWANVEER